MDWKKRYALYTQPPNVKRNNRGVYQGITQSISGSASVARNTPAAPREGRRRLNKTRYRREYTPENQVINKGFEIIFGHVRRIKKSALKKKKNYGE